MQETYQIRDEIASAKWRGSVMLSFRNFDGALTVDYGWWQVLLKGDLKVSEESAAAPSPSDSLDCGSGVAALFD
jgi:hypothetical protein